MSLPRQQRQRIKNDILQQVRAKTFNVAELGAKWQLSRQSVYRYVDDLQRQGAIVCVDQAAPMAARYTLAGLDLNRTYKNEGLEEDIAWHRDIVPFVGDLPAALYDKAEYLFCGMLHNAIQHSEGDMIRVRVQRNALSLDFSVRDNGVGIFHKIAAALRLADKRYAPLELAKGKFTTDPAQYSGEGIFYATHVADVFGILSDDIIYMPRGGVAPAKPGKRLLLQGTDVSWQLYYDSDITLEEVFARFDDAAAQGGFAATVVPLALLEYSGDRPVLASRAAARRLCRRLEQFRRVTLDFAGVAALRQAFADEVFRVFAARQPHTELQVINTTPPIDAMIRHVRGGPSLPPV